MPAQRIDVLLAMGSPALLRVTEEALLREGLSVKTVSDGIDAVTLSFSLKPRCVLCGQVLAGMDGMKVCRLLNSVFSPRDLPVIISVPDSSPGMRNRAISAGAVAVVDYSTPPDDVSKLVRLHLSMGRSVSPNGGVPVHRDRILPMAADCLEDSLESIETVIRLASELRGVTSIPEACRKMAASILEGLGLQRVWIGLLNKSGTAVEAVAYRGRGLTGEPIGLSESGCRLPAEIAVSRGVQVSTWESDFPETQATWVGSVVYVDTPLKIGERVVGIIRCDNGISKKRPSDSTMKALEMLSDLLSSFIRYIDVQSRLDSLRSTFESILKKLSTAAIVFRSGGAVEEIYGIAASISGLENTSIGMHLTELLESLPDSQREIIENVVLERKDADVDTVLQTGENCFTALSVLHGESGGVTLVASDNGVCGRLQKRVMLLEQETDAIASLAADLTSEADAREICRTMARTLEAFYPDESIAVLAAGEVPSSITPDRLVVHATSGSGYEDGAILPGATILVREGASESGIMAEAVRTGRIINVPDVIQSDVYLSGLPDTRSELAIPMISRGKVVGLIDLQSAEQNRFRRDDIRRLNNLVGFAAGTLETALQQTELINMARRDRLTGLHNMTFFEERYPEEFERAQRYEYSFSLIMMDIDDFKHYNDSFGHPMGNVLLQKVTGAMLEALREVDILVRYGGEEFVCILPLTDKQVSADIAERIRLKVLEASEGIPNSAKQPRGFVSLSLGVATFPVDSREKDELLEIADQRMYRAKRAGKNSVCYN